MNNKQSGITVGVTVCVAANLSSLTVVYTLVIHPTGCNISYNILPNSQEWTIN